VLAQNLPMPLELAQALAHTLELALELARALRFR
jgi:hypothetical protein